MGQSGDVCSSAPREDPLVLTGLCTEVAGISAAFVTVMT